MQTAFSESLPCELSAAEVASKAQELARAERCYQVLEDEKKKATANLSKLMKEERKRMAELAKEVRDGVEYRDIQCAERHAHDPAFVEVVRLDSGSVFRRRPVSDDERQVSMFENAALGRTPKGKGKLAPVPEPDNDNDEPRNRKH